MISVIGSNFEYWQEIKGFDKVPTSKLMVMAVVFFIVGDSYLEYTLIYEMYCIIVAWVLLVVIDCEKAQE